MSTYLYDEAIMNKLKRWGLPNSATLLSPNDIQNLYDIINQQNGDRGIALPLITLNRSGNFNITRVEKSPLSINALKIAKTKERSMQLNAIPIELEYQLDIYARQRVQADEYARELAFNFINYPEIEIIVPYEGANYTHKSMIILENDIVDNSNVPERIVHGQFTRYTMRLKVNDAYLFDVRLRDNIQKISWNINQDGSMEVEGEVEEKED